MVSKATSQIARSVANDLDAQSDGGSLAAGAGKGPADRSKKLRKSEITRNRILIGASTVFSDKGFDATTINDIADNLNMSTASLYYYYKSKENLFISCIEFELENFLNILRSSYDDQMTPTEKLKRLVEAQIRCEVTNISRAPMVNFHIYGAHSLKKILDESAAERLRLLQRDVLDLYRSIIRDGIDQRLMRTSNITVAAFNIIAMIQYIPTWYKERKGRNLNDIVDTQIHFIMKMLSN